MTYDADNRLATFNGQAVSHDLDGNMTYGPLTNDTFVSYTYDARNRLVQVGGTGSTPSMGYYYDPTGNRVAMTNHSNGQVTRFVVNPNAKLSQVLIRIRPGVTNYYVYGLGLLYEVTETATNSYARYYHYDYRGSTVALTDHSGSVTDRFEYSAYGMLTYRTGNTDTPFLFNGRFGVQTDPNGLLYMRARYYNPYICRFINPDPIGFAGGLNWYAFADGNPVNYLDPYGLAYGNPVCGPDGQMYPSDPFAPGGAYYVPSAWKPDIMTSFVTGVAVGAVIAGAVTVGAPAAVSGLVAGGVPTATASAAVTGTLGVAGAFGGGLTIASTFYSALDGDWNAVAFNAGTLAGGGLVGISGGGRFMANNMGAGPSSIPIGANPFIAEAGMGYDPALGNIWNWLATAPTPASGGAAATGIAGGVGLLIQLSGTFGDQQGSWITPSFNLGSSSKSPTGK